MANLLGLGVFGTFGQPYGFQQAFNADVQFNHSLDLEQSDIELFPNTELFAVKRELFLGGYSMSFCMYSYVREMNANRSSTFLGSCIVLQHVYIDAEKIYKLLRELHSDLIENTQNVNNNTIQVRQAVNLVVREPSSFQSAKFSVKSIEDTPYYSTNVNSQKKCFVHTEHIESASQIIAFFDEALKNYGDTETLYFSYSDKVADSVIRKGNLKVINWDEFTNYKYLVQQGVVRTKKGIKHPPAHVTAMPETDTRPEAPIAEPQVAAKIEAVEAIQVEEAPVKAIPEPVMPVASQVQEVSAPAYTEPIPDIPEPNFPFNGWGEPRGVWALDETIRRVHEYNRLLQYAKHLQEHNDNLQYHIETLTEPSLNETESVKAETQPQPQSQPYVQERQDRIANEETEEKEPFYENKNFFLLVIGIAVLFAIAGYLIFSKQIFKKHVKDQVDTVATTTEMSDTSKPIAGAPVKDTVKAINDTVATKTQPAEPPKTADKPADKPVDKPDVQQNIKALFPASNFELSASEAMALSRAGIKNKTLSDITNMIFQKFPVNVGDVYKHELGDYSMNLLSANKNSFRKNGAEYVCTTDTLMHIPAYKSPKVPVAFPK